MSSGTIKIHGENILPIIKRWLYSDKEIFVRELVSNSCDALQKLRILREQGQLSGVELEERIDIKIDKEAKKLLFMDTGIGMDAEEVEKYIAQLAFSGAEDFVKKYESKDAKEQIIGHFGLGFYSVYMAAKTVEVDTLSFKEGAKAAHWICEGSHDYELKEGQRQERGTTISLHIEEGSEEYLEEARIREILVKYCAFLPFPIYLNDQQINKNEPLWKKAPSECTKEEYLEFYRKLYPMAEEPLFWVHLNVDYPFNLQGILYFPRVKKDFDFKKNSIKLFCNRVFVSDNCQDLIPEYLMVLQGAIDSPDIPLNVSRSSLQMDRTVRQLAGHISKKVSDKLTSLYKNDREAFLAAWKDVELIVKLGAMEDVKFYERVKDLLVWKNSKSEWTSVEDYLERNQEKHKDKIFYTMGEESDSQVLKLYEEKGIEVLCSSSVMDTHLMSFIESKMMPTRFTRIDSAIDDLILDSSREKTLLDAEGKTEAAKIADIVRSSLDLKDLEVEAKSLSSDDLPGFVTVDETFRRLKEYGKMNGGMISGFDNMPQRRTFVVNTNHSLVQSLEKLKAKKPELCKDVLEHLYESALLSQREMDPKSLNAFVTRGYRIMKELL